MRWCLDNSRDAYRNAGRKRRAWNHRRPIRTIRTADGVHGFLGHITCDSRIDGWIVGVLDIGNPIIYCFVLDAPLGPENLLRYSANRFDPIWQMYLVL